MPHNPIWTCKSITDHLGDGALTGFDEWNGWISVDSIEIVEVFVKLSGMMPKNVLFYVIKFVDSIF